MFQPHFQKVLNTSSVQNNNNTSTSTSCSSIETAFSPPVSKEVDGITYFNVQRKKTLSTVPAKYDRRRTRVRELLDNATSSVGKRVVVKGWLRTTRSGQKGSLIFAEISDGSISTGLQVVVDSTVPGFDVLII